MRAVRRESAGLILSFAGFRASLGVLLGVTQKVRVDPGVSSDKIPAGGLNPPGFRAAMHALLNRFLSAESRQWLEPGMVPQAVVDPPNCSPSDVLQASQK